MLEREVYGLKDDSTQDKDPIDLTVEFVRPK
jgi:hypothetical protein